MGIGRIFSEGGASAIFPDVAMKVFPGGGPKVVKFYFFFSKL